MMLYKYDEAICKDLERSFNPDSSVESIVKVISPEGMIDVVAQIKEGNMTYPVVGLTRSDSINMDTTRINFSRMKRGQSTVMDLKTNELYYEKVIPIDLSYTMTVLATNTADMDEIVRELLFKYSSMYFLTVKLPYEADRKTRFGVIIDQDSMIERQSGSYEYISGGTLYQTRIGLKCDGCVLVHYTPVKLRRVDRSAEIVPDLIGSNTM